ncbi:MAG: hypothetical protein CMJ70_13960 [Planctomycetaceae bacterium]|nr:hypothetical protein [Planctomycetaceae bacterium]
MSSPFQPRTARPVPSAGTLQQRIYLTPTQRVSTMPANSTLPNKNRVSLWNRIRVATRLLWELRGPDFQAAGTFVRMRYGQYSLPVRWFYFLGWALRQMWIVIPDALCHLQVPSQVSSTPMWLMTPNPLANHPWQNAPQQQLPTEVDTVVIGAGFTGAATAYHWRKHSPPERSLLILEMDDPASGSSGRNEGLVVMGRYFKMVQETVLHNLNRVRHDLTDSQRLQLARQFADRYCRAAYRNAELIEKTIMAESFECDYARAGWVQARTAAEQSSLAESIALATENGYHDWTSITPQEVLKKTGMRVQHNAGFSIAAASWHPAKWVWCLLQTALQVPQVSLYTRTRVTALTDEGPAYRVETTRGTVTARHVVLATESYTPALQAMFHDAILPMQEQAASGDGGPAEMQPHVGISGTWWFAGRYGKRVLFGSGGSRVRDREAGRNRPSRFLTKFIAGEMKQSYGPFQLELQNEWSGTVGYTPDEFPIVGNCDGKHRYIIGGMCGSGSGVSFNAARCIVNRILNRSDEIDDYPAAYFSPTRLLDPRRHQWPQLETTPLDDVTT